MNITDYLLLPEQAKWAKEKGFNSHCSHMYIKQFPKDAPTYYILMISTGRDGVINSALESYNLAAPTFDAFFDWVKKTYKIKAIIDCDNLANDWYEPHKWGNETYRVGFFLFARSTVFYEAKRSARIAACEAIIKYINENHN